MNEDRRVCSVADAECIAPAAVGIPGVGYSDADLPPARGTCVSCGEPVCGKCSRIMRRKGKARGRWCFYCLELEGLPLA